MGNNGIFLIMGNAGFTSSTVLCGMVSALLLCLMVWSFGLVVVMVWPVAVAVSVAMIIPKIDSSR